MSESGSTGATAPRRTGPSPSSSRFSDKQIFRSVKDEALVMAVLHTGEEVTGWICGSDSFHWGIVDRHGTVHLIHKSVPAIKILQPVQVPEEVKPIVSGFQQYVLTNHFNHAPA